MRDLPPGWATDLAILELGGSTVDDPGENYLFASRVAARWVETFQVAFPEATWIAIGLARPPEEPDDWVAHGLTVEPDDVLTTRILPRETPLPGRYTVRRLRGADWGLSLARAVAENDRTGEEDPQSFRRFAREQRRAWRALCEDEVAAFFGAFADDELVAELGIVRCGTTARYQSVSTDEDHRRRGLASHLLGIAARWADARGCDRWVIVTEATNAAGRVYRRLGFEPDTGTATAYRKPVRA